MKHLGLPFALIGFFLVPLYAQVSNSSTAVTGPAPNSTAPVPSNPQSRHVMILVSATDRSGSPATRLTEKDLSVVDNGQTAEVLSVRSASQFPLRMAFVLLAGKASFAQQQAAAIELAHKVMRPNIDAAFVITARGDKSWSNPHLEWQGDADKLEKAVRALDKNTGFPDEFAFDMSTENAGANRHFTLLQYGRNGTGVFSILWAMLESDPRPARHVVVMFRDPWAHSPGFGGAYTLQVEDNHVHLIADAQHLWTSFYIIPAEEAQAVSKELTAVYAPLQTGAGGDNRVYDQDLERARNRAYDRGKANLERLATETGGALWWNPKKNYSDAVAGIQNRLNSAYAVTYAVHSEPGDGPKHVLVVKPLNSDLRVSTQTGYVSRQTTAPATAPPPPQLQKAPTDN